MANTNFEKDSLSSRTQKTFKAIKKEFPELDFEYNKKENTIFSKSSIHHVKSDFRYNVIVKLTNNEEIKIKFLFDEIPFNPDTLYFVNVFNQNCPCYYKAYVQQYRHGQPTFTIDYVRRYSSIMDAAKQFQFAMSYLTHDDLYKYLKPIHKFMYPESKPLKEMN